MASVQALDRSQRGDPPGDGANESNADDPTPSKEDQAPSKEDQGKQEENPSPASQLTDKPDPSSVPGNTPPASTGNVSGPPKPNTSAPNGGGNTNAGGNTNGGGGGAPPTGNNLSGGTPPVKPPPTLGPVLNQWHVESSESDSTQPGPDPVAPPFRPLGFQLLNRPPVPVKPTPSNPSVTRPPAPFSDTTPPPRPHIPPRRTPPVAPITLPPRRPAPGPPIPPRWTPTPLNVRLPNLNPPRKPPRKQSATPDPNHARDDQAMVLRAKGMLAEWIEAEEKLHRHMRKWEREAIGKRFPSMPDDYAKWKKLVERADRLEKKYLGHEKTLRALYRGRKSRLDRVVANILNVQQTFEQTSPKLIRLTYPMRTRTLFYDLFQDQHRRIKPRSCTNEEVKKENRHTARILRDGRPKNSGNGNRKKVRSTSENEIEKRMRRLLDDWIEAEDILYDAIPEKWGNFATDNLKRFKTCPEYRKWDKFFRTADQRKAKFERELRILSQSHRSLYRKIKCWPTPGKRIFKGREPNIPLELRDLDDWKIQYGSDHG